MLSYPLFIVAIENFGLICGKPPLVVVLPLFKNIWVKVYGLGFLRLLCGIYHGLQFARKYRKVNGLYRKNHNFQILRYTLVNYSLTTQFTVVYHKIYHKNRGKTTGH